MKTLTTVMNILSDLNRTKCLKMLQDKVACVSEPHVTRHTAQP